MLFGELYDKCERPDPGENVPSHYLEVSLFDFCGGCILGYAKDLIRVLSRNIRSVKSTL